MSCFTEKYPVIFWALAVIYFLCPVTYAGEVEIPSSFNPVGSGARAIGMGGAFIAVADDATSASWNPGGLVRLTCNANILNQYEQIASSAGQPEPPAYDDDGSMTAYAGRKYICNAENRLTAVTYENPAPGPEKSHICVRLHGQTCEKDSFRLGRPDMD